MREHEPLLLEGLDLRYVLDIVLFECADELSIPDLVDRLVLDGFVVRGRAGKTVSDALRWEVRRGRVRRVAKGRYAIGVIANTTLWRMRRRTRALRDDARIQRSDHSRRSDHG